MMNRTWLATCLLAVGAQPALAQVAVPRDVSHKAAQKDTRGTLDEIAGEAQLFAYRLLVMDATRHVDALETGALLDLLREPVVLHVPKLNKGKAPTNLASILGRTQISGPSQLANASALSGQYSLTRSASRRKAYRPMKKQSIGAEIEMAQEASLAIVAAPSNRTYAKNTALAAQKTMRGARGRAKKQKRRHTSELGKSKISWKVDFELDEHGGRYLVRATVASRGLGASLPEDALYTAGFWSLTRYGMGGYLVQNSIERFAIANRDALKRNLDDSLDIWVQHEKPQEPWVSNWLSAPQAAFQLILRMYGPKRGVLDRTW